MRKNRTQQILGDLARTTIEVERDPDRVYRHITQAAVYLATAGYLKAANRLLVGLWSSGLPHSRNVRLADRAMSILWHTAENFPENAPFEILPIDAIEVLHRNDISGGEWNSDFGSNPRALTPRQIAFGRFIRAVNSIRAVDGIMPSREVELTAIDDFAAFFEPGMNGPTAMTALVCLAELCAKNGQIDDAKRYVIYWQEAFAQNDLNTSFELMPTNRHVAPLLLDGLLAETCDLNPETSDRYVVDLLASLHCQLVNGARLPYSGTSWASLLDKLSALAIDAAEPEFSDEAIDTNWLGREPARDADISAVEMKLDVKLPEDYVAFLKTSNGFAATSETSVRIFEISEVDWLDNSYPDFEIYDCSNPPNIGEPIGGCILIGDSFGEQRLLLVPVGDGGEFGPKRWECWFSAHWIPGEIAYKNFREFVEKEVLNLEMQS